MSVRHPGLIGSEEGVHRSPRWPARKVEVGWECTFGERPQPAVAEVAGEHRHIEPGHVIGSDENGFPLRREVFEALDLARGSSIMVGELCGEQWGQSNLGVGPAEPQNELAPSVHYPAAVLGFRFEKAEGKNPE